MKYTYTITVLFTKRQEQTIISALNGRLSYDDDNGEPAGMGYLMSIGFMHVVPDPRGTIRRHYDLTAKGRKFAEENCKKETQWVPS